MSVNSTVVIRTFIARLKYCQHEKKLFIKSDLCQYCRQNCKENIDKNCLDGNAEAMSMEFDQ